MEVLEHQDDRGTGSDALEERAPRGEQLVRCDLGFQPEQRQEGRLDPLAFGRIIEVVGDRLRTFAAGRGLVIGLGQPAALADHLAERPERDALAVCRRPAAVPVRVLDDPVDVLEELPRQPRLADAGRTDDRHQAQAGLAPGREEQVLQETQLVIPTDERRLEALRPVPSPDLGHDAQRPPRRDRRRLALEGLLADRLERDGPAGGSLGRLTDQDRSRRCHRLEARRRVDEIPRDHPLVDGAHRHGRLAGQDPGPGLNVRTEDADRIHQLQPGPDRPLGVVLVGGRRAPHRHDRVADELLDRPAVSADDLGRELEVAGQGVPDFFRVTLLGERGEADQVREEHADDPPLRDWARRHWRCSRRASGRPRLSGWPQSAQKRAPGRLAAPQFGQPELRPAPQLSQNRRPASFSVPQFAQSTRSSLGRAARGYRTERSCGTASAFGHDETRAWAIQWSAAQVARPHSTLISRVRDEDGNPQDQDPDRHAPPQDEGHQPAEHDRQPGHEQTDAHGGEHEPARSHGPGRVR